MRNCLIIAVTIAIAISGCVKREVVGPTSETETLIEHAENFYTFIIKREIGVWHNDQDEKFMEFFLDNDSYYDFMDSFLYVLRDRDMYRNTVTQYYIRNIELSEDGSKATLSVKFLSRDAYLLYRKIDATHTWEKTYDVWYPKKIYAPELNWYEQYTERYGLPPRN